MVRHTIFPTNLLLLWRLLLSLRGESGKSTIGEIFSIGENLIRNLYRQLFPPFFKAKYLLRQLFPPIPKSAVFTYPAFSPMSKNCYLGCFFHPFQKVLSLYFGCIFLHYLQNYLGSSLLWPIQCYHFGKRFNSYSGLMDF